MRIGKDHSWPAIELIVARRSKEKRLKANLLKMHLIVTEMVSCPSKPSLESKSHRNQDSFYKNKSMRHQDAESPSTYSNRFFCQVGSENLH